MAPDGDGPLSDDGGNEYGQQPVRDGDSPGGSGDRPGTESVTSGSSKPRLVSRVVVTWVELTVVGITGGLLGATVGGPPGFVIYLVTTLLTVGIIFHNVNELVKAWLRTFGTDRTLE